MKTAKTTTRPNAFQLDIAASIIDVLQQRGATSGEMVSERDLAAELRISRSPIRAALGVLVDRGVMALEPGTGWRVARMPKQKADRVIPESGDLDGLELRIARDRFCGKTADHFSEADFMKRYEISRGDLRKILQRLSQHGMVARARGHGWHFLPMLDTVRAQRASYDLRIAIEPAALLADTWTLDPARLARARQEHERALESGNKQVSGLGLFEMNARFHLMLAEFSGNEFFVQNIRQQNELRRVNDYFVAVTDERVALCREHLLIVEAIEKGDRLWAASLMERHLRSSRDLLGESDQPADKASA
jgi:DNA-binding GntR family transcriptional regulator